MNKHHWVTFLGAISVLIGSSSCGVKSSAGSSLKSDYQVIEQKITQFHAESKNYASCTGLSNLECIAGLDKLLQLSTTSLFPNQNFRHIFVAHAFEDVDSNGFVDFDVNATVTEIGDRLAAQTSDFQVIEQKITQFHAESKNYASCTTGLSNLECIAGLDKLLQLSTTSLFPNQNFRHIFVAHAFEDVDSDGFVDFDMNAAVADIQAFLARQ